MAFVWLFALLTLMAGPSRGKKVKKENNVKHAKDKPILGRFTIGDFADSDVESSMDWDALSSSDEEAPVQGPSVKEEDEEDIERAPIPLIRYTRRRSTKASGVRFNDSVISPQWGQRESLRFGGIPAPMQPSTTQEGESSQPTSNLDSCQLEHQRLMEEQTKLVQNLEEVRAELKDVKKKQNKLSRMLTNIYSLIGSSNSIDLDSD